MFTESYSTDKEILSESLVLDHSKPNQTGLSLERKIFHRSNSHIGKRNKFNEMYFSTVWSDNSILIESIASLKKLCITSFHFQLSQFNNA